MEPEETPPAIAQAVMPAAAPIAKWRWWLHLIVLAAFPISAGVMGILLANKPTALMPPSVGGLLQVVLRELIFFAGIFLVAWLFSRANRRQLLLQWRGQAMPMVWGIAYSIALRLIIIVLGVTVAMFWVIFREIISGGRPDAAHDIGLRPQVEHLVNGNALVGNPIYFALMLTLVSFVMGGLREELWRAGMLAGIRELFPGAMASRAGLVLSIVAVAVIFGLAHTTQGYAGVVVTTVLGIGLGAIMVRHESIWEAAIAHGLFDATTFVLMYAAVKYFPGQVPGL